MSVYHSLYCNFLLPIRDASGCSDDELYVFDHWRIDDICGDILVLEAEGICGAAFRAIGK
jgi:hypothetical protein